MPFIVEEERTQVENEFAVRLFEGNFTPGQRCFLVYKDLITTWANNPNWTIGVDKNYEFVSEKWTGQGQAWCRAASLAWQVFFQLHVMPYELKKREENGDIE